MVDYKEEDQEIKESFEEYEKFREQQKKPSPKAILGNIPQNVIIGIIGVTIFVAYLTFITKTIEQSMFIWYIVGIFILFMVLSAREEGQRKELIPEEQLKAVLFTKLKEKQRISPTEVPMGDINMMLPSKLKKIEGRPIKYVFSFKIITPSGLEKYFTAEMNPYDGYIMGFEERPAGFRGTEVSDVAFIRKREDVWEEKYFKGK